MIIILSSKFIENEFQTEFGEIPPISLPIQHRCLIDLQLDTIRKIKDKLLITIPNGYDLPDHINKKILQNKGKVLQFDANLKLGEIIFNVLQTIEDEIYRIYYGDTLITNGLSNNKDDFYFITKTYSENNWLYLQNKKKFFSGYFQFKSKNKIIEILTKNKYDFDIFFKEITQNYLKPKTNNQILDFGHINTYFLNKAKYLKSRSFNNIEYKNNKIIKKSINKIKLIAEIKWFQNIPAELKQYSVQLLDKSDDYYSTEYLPFVTLSEYYLYTKIPIFTWKKIINSIERYLHTIRYLDIDKRKLPSINAYKKNFLNHIEGLYKYIEKEKFFDLNENIVINKKKFKSFNFEFEKLKKRLLKHNPQLTNIHGDFSLSNIFFDQRSNLIKLIDPRGLDFANKNSIYGDFNYEIAKLFQFIYGNYDEILSNNYEFITKDNQYSIKIYKNKYRESVKKLFINSTLKKSFFNSQTKDLIKILYMSMIPNHKDRRDRQLIFILNSILI